jgi:tetratricopeptide (TPR) repeat protein
VSTRARSAGGLVLVGAGLLVVGALVALFVMRRGPALPEPGSEQYEQVTRAFYWGLAALDVGLLDDARQQFEKAATAVPEEPASWANLGLAHLRLGDLEAAVAPVERALMLMPGNGAIVLLAARMDAARGEIDAATARLRQAIELDPSGLRARFALADELQRLNTPEADAEALTLLDEIVRRAPANLAALIERGRIAARRADEERLAAVRQALGPLSTAWPAQAQEQFADFERSVDARQFDDAVRASTFLRNVLAPVPAFRESLIAVRTPAELIAEPFDRFLLLTPPPATPSPSDPTITFTPETLSAPDAEPDALLALFRTIDEPPTLAGAYGTELRLLVDGEPAVALPVPVGPSGLQRATPSGVLAVDWNHDFRTDIVMGGSGGVRLFVQGASEVPPDQPGGFVFTDQTAQASATSPVTNDVFGVWGADVEMDGDIDIVVGATEGPPFVLRNNGEGTWRRLAPFTGIEAVRGFAWADLDMDADADAVFLDRAGRVHVFFNRQAGQFARAPEVSGLAVIAGLGAADIDADGFIDILAVAGSGIVVQVSWDGASWRVEELVRAPVPAGGNAGEFRVLAADLDNSGTLDLIAAGKGASNLWLAGEDREFERLDIGQQTEVYAAFDRNADGRLDLAAVASDRAAWMMGGGGSAAYHWKIIRPRAQQSAGDQRINSFGVGGQISVRSGLLVQTQVMTGSPVHFGLGDRTGIDVARIVWPSGIAQAEFGTAVDDAMVAEQRLKGSCPWVFAWNGTSMGFVTDFLWRSPLGLRINAQDTAGVTQTEDWIRIAGDQLVPRDGMYDVRITAELWETHFFDHVSLLVVDRPAETEMFVDERFHPARPPALTPRAMRIVGPVARARDHRGRDVTEIVSARDGQYVAMFDRGPYQGIAEEHVVEFELGSVRPERATLVANGWIYPTDSSINVAIGQGGHVRPSGVSLEALTDRGWVAVDADLGYPAGKNKTMLIDLGPTARTASRLRLRTNLEIYWDSLILAEAVDVPLRTTRLPAASADLRFRGYSETVSPRGDAPETPIYERKAGVTQRWRDLTGFHTRFGSVNALLLGVDDRYVIMNAGDEMRLTFPEQPPPGAGWRRDFVLIGDGWEKDGDYNTGFSQTVLPLPSHDRSAYGNGPPPGDLEADPVYQRHRADWNEYHTRYVTPDAFVRGLRRH